MHAASPKYSSFNPLYAIALLICGAVGEFALFWLSIQYEVYEVYEGLISWYFPVGLRVLLLLLLSWRYLGFAWFGIIIGNALFYVSFLDSSVSFFNLLESGLFAVIPLLPAVVIAKYYFNKQTQFGLNSIGIMVIFGLAYRFINITTLWLTQEYMYAQAPEIGTFVLFFAHQLSGYIGIFVVLQWYFTTYWLVHHRHDLTQYVSLVIQLVGLLILTLGLYHLQPQTAYLMQMLAFIPIIWFAYRYQWIGALLTIIVCNTMILVHVYQGSSAELILYQPYIISYSLVGFLVGGVMLEHAKTMRNISSVGKQLLIKREELQQSTQHVKQLSLDMLNVQEQERNWLSQELQAEVRQNLIQFNTAIYKIETQPQMFASILTGMKKNTRSMYDSVYMLMHWLRPRVLDELGLQNVLEGTFFQFKLLKSNIRYSGSVTGDCLSLNEAQTIGIFRIVQDAVTDAIKQRNISSLDCQLDIQDASICLIISDDRFKLSQESAVTSAMLKPGFTPEFKPEFMPELQSVMNRVISLGGKMDINQQDGLILSITLTP
jgi:glucose-6-phosphate-specific signal transduction histidine kinase